MNKKPVGDMGEGAAAEVLRRSGMVLLERNYRRSTGEIDLIAQDKGTIVFVEVKCRATSRYGRPAEAVTRAKQLRILRTAQIYLHEKRLDDVSVRFDVIEVYPDETNHIPAAFDATGFAL